LFRISKIYKSFSSNAKQKNKNRKIQNKESKVGRKMSEVATKSVILLVFILLILLPLFNADFWIDQRTSGDMLCDQISMILNTKFEKDINPSFAVFDPRDASEDITDQGATLAKLVKESIDDHISQSLGPLLRINFDSSIDYYHHAEYNLYRDDQMVNEKCRLASGKFVSIFQKDAYYDSVDSWLSLLRTLYICAVLIGGSYFFSWNTHHVVIAPIERMIDRVMALIDRPQIVKEEAFIEQEEKDFKMDLKLDKDESKKLLEDDQGGSSNQLETKYLETAINKIGVLLSVGLGEAGSELINCYLNKETDILNIANSINALFGFCDIRNFTDATEVLQEEVLVFVNTIADIVHSIADGGLGAANKNVGDAFLIVWRINPDDDVGSSDFADENIIWMNLADLALYSILCITSEIGRAYSLKKFVDNPKMKERVKNFRIRLGFGLHYGWAIEGALGSHYKVDVTYLSPNVNMAATLEGETKKYGVPILVSGEAYDKLSPYVKGYCRQIDSVDQGHGSELRLYTPLINDKHLKYTESTSIDRHILKTKERFYFKKVARTEILRGKSIGQNLFENSLQISIIAGTVSPEFKKTFRKAYYLFEGGIWPTAKEMFDAVLKIDPEDGPTRFLLQYMEKMGGVAPHDWKGVRKEAGGMGH